MSIFSFHNENNSTLSPGLLGNGALTCSGLHFWRHFLIKCKIFPREKADNLRSKFAFTRFLIKPVYLWKRTLQEIIVHVFICLLHVNEGSMCILTFTTKFYPDACSKTLAWENRLFSPLIAEMSVFTGYKNVLIKNICFDSLLGSKSRASDWSEALWYVRVYLLCKTNAPIFCWFENFIINNTGDFLNVFYHHLIWGQITVYMQL